jgi:hypothetical protein
MRLGDQYEVLHQDAAPRLLITALRCDVARGSFCQPAQLTQTRIGLLTPIATMSRVGPASS